MGTQTTMETTNGTALHAPPPPEVLMLSTERMHEDPNQPRKRFGDLESLAQDIKKNGVLQPGLARPHPTIPGDYMVVFGARRFRGTRIAKIGFMPFTVRALSDKEALEMQIAENGEREDVHPLEEAEGYEQLREKHGYTADAIAARFHKTKATVYARLKLLDLSKEARKAFYDGRLTLTSALEVARLPHADIQKQAIEMVGIKPDHAQQPSAREVHRIIQDKFMLRLADAPFDRADKTLLPAAGDCGACPKRTGNQKELFADVKSADVCTDQRCFGEKRDAHWARITAEAKERGQKVLTDKESRELFAYGFLPESAPYIDLKEKFHAHEGSANKSNGKTYESILGKKKLESMLPILARDSKGVVRELLPKSELKDLFKRPKAPPKPASADGRVKKDEPAIEGRRQAIAKIASLAAKSSKVDLWRVIVGTELDSGITMSVDEEIALLERVGCNGQKDLVELVDSPKAKESTLRAIYVELRLFQQAETLGPELSTLAKAYKVDVKQFEAKARAAAKTKAKAPKADDAPATKSKPKRAKTKGKKKAAAKKKK